MSARPAVYGGQLVTNKGRFVGINLGFNFYCEFESGVDTLVKNINKTVINSVNNPHTVRGTLKLRKTLQTNQKLASRFIRTPFGNGMIYKDIQIFRREIIIDNTDIQDKYIEFRTINGNYSVISLGNLWTIDYWNKRFNSRRKFNESELLYMPDYNYNIEVNPGFMLNKTQASKEQKQFAAIWGSKAYGLAILLNKDILGDNIVDQIEKAIRSGSVSIVSEEPRLFKNHGCCIVNCEEAYFGRRNN